MHIGLVCNEYPPAVHGGIGTFSYDLAEGLVSRGHEVTVIGVYHPNVLGLSHDIAEVISGVKVIRLVPASEVVPYHFRAVWDRWRLSMTFKREHKYRPIDLIEAPDYGGWLAFGTPSGIPRIVRLHGAELYLDFELSRKGSNFKHWMEKRWISNADRIVSVSNYAGKKTLELIMAQDKKYEVIHNAIDTDMFSPSADVNLEQGLVLFTNSIVPNKGVEQLMDAINIVCRYAPEAHLLLIGKNLRKLSDGSSYSNGLLSRLDTDIRTRVRFSGHQSRDYVLENLRKANLCCYPSRAEGLGIAPLEAMAVGAAVIFTQRGPGPEVIEDGESGLLCDPYDAGDIADKIRMLLDNPELAQKLGRNARNRAIVKFDKKSWLSKNIEYYQLILSNIGG